MTSERCVAVWIEPTGEYQVDLTRAGVRRDWPAEIVWEVARREMRRRWNKPVTGWGWSSHRKETQRVLTESNRMEQNGSALGLGMVTTTGGGLG